MTFVLGDKLAGVTLTLRLVNLGRRAAEARRAPGLQAGAAAPPSAPARGLHRHSWGPLPAPCQPPALLEGLEGGGRAPLWGQGHSRCTLQAPPRVWLPPLPSKAEAWTSCGKKAPAPASGWRDALCMLKETKREGERERRERCHQANPLTGHCWVSLGPGGAPRSPLGEGACRML